MSAPATGSASSAEMDGTLAALKFDRMKVAVTLLLKGLGEDPGREGLRDTPERVVKAWQEMTSGYEQNPTDVVGRAVFNEPDLTSGSLSGVVCVRDIDFASTSSDNLLPFFGRCHIAYAPHNGAVLGLSKFARLVGVLSKRVQSQQELTLDLVDAISREVNPKGVAVIVEAQHMGFGMVTGSPLVTFASNGSFDTEVDAQQEMQAAFLLNGVSSVGKLSPSSRSAGSEWHFVTEKNSLLLRGSMLKSALEALFTELGLSEIKQGFRMAVDNYIEELLHRTTGYRMSIPSTQSTGADTPTSVDTSVPSEPTSSPRRLEYGVVPAPPLSISDSDTECNLEMGDCCLQHSRWKFTRKDHTDHCECSSDEGIEGGSFLFQSMCEHHLLPFQGRIFVGYIPRSAQAVIPKCRLEEIVSMYSLRLQLQERIISQIAVAIEDLVDPVGLVVMGRANHMCMVARGVQSHSSTTVNTVVRGDMTASILKQGVLVLSKKID